MCATGCTWSKSQVQPNQCPQAVCPTGAPGCLCEADTSQQQSSAWAVLTLLPWLSQAQEFTADSSSTRVASIGLWFWQHRTSFLIQIHWVQSGCYSRVLQEKLSRQYRGRKEGACRGHSLATT